MNNTELINCDCLPYMRKQPDNSFDLCISDPPYGININHNMGRRKGNKHSGFKPASWDSEPPSVEVFDKMKRISKNQIIWGANHFIDRIGLPSSCWIVWDKLFSEDVSFASCELAYTSFTSVVKRIKISSARPDGIHPTQKPVKLYQWLLDNYAEKGQRILDTHLGSGSSAIAAHYFGCDFVGMEIDEDYYKAACERFDRETRQLAMF